MTRSIDGVGKASIDGPRSPWTMRRQEVAVLLGQRLVDAVQIGQRRAHLLDGFRAEIRSGRDPAEGALDRVDGERWVIRNAVEMPTTMTRIVCIARLDANQRYAFIDGASSSVISWWPARAHDRGGCPARWPDTRLIVRSQPPTGASWVRMYLALAQLFTGLAYGFSAFG